MLKTHDRKKLVRKGYLGVRCSFHCVFAKIAAGVDQNIYSLSMEKIKNIFKKKLEKKIKFHHSFILWYKI